MARFVTLGHCIVNAELVTYVTHQFDPRAGGAHLRVGFLHGSEIAIPVKDLGPGLGREAQDDAIAHVMDALGAGRD